MAESVLELVDVVRRFGRIDALAGVDLDLQRGEVVGLLGHSGAGKTTVVFLVMALWTGPTLAAMALSAVLLVSVRVETTQAAFQLGGVVVLPVIAILITQATGALLLSAWLLVLAGLVALAVAAGLLALGASSLARPRLGVKLR
ncbi:MAG TPA: ATP-binding cassette domain-containing protein [Acidimicrobiia bacterium]|nr:ATP-binding cassette domain-containing protein [Acidimicrobiia bacterium]